MTLPSGASQGTVLSVAWVVIVLVALSFPQLREWLTPWRNFAVFYSVVMLGYVGSLVFDAQWFQAIVFSLIWGALVAIGLFVNWRREAARKARVTERRREPSRGH